MSNTLAPTSTCSCPVGRFWRRCHWLLITAPSRRAWVRFPAYALIALWLIISANYLHLMFFRQNARISDQLPGRAVAVLLGAVRRADPGEAALWLSHLGRVEDPRPALGMGLSRRHLQHQRTLAPSALVPGRLRARAHRGAARFHLRGQARAGARDRALMTTGSKATNVGEVRVRGEPRIAIWSRQPPRPAISSTTQRHSTISSTARRPPSVSGPIRRFRSRRSIRRAADAEPGRRRTGPD